MGTLKWVFLATDGRLRPTWRALLYVPVFAATLAPFIALLMLASKGGGGGGGTFGAGAIVGSVLGSACTLWAAWILLRVADHRPFPTLGFWFYGGWGKELAVGIGGAAAMMTAMVAPLAAAGAIELRWAAFEPAQLAVGLAWSAGILVPAAAFEEFLFRGYPFQRLVEGWGPWIPSVGLSALFGLAHLDNPNAGWFSTVNTVLAGIWLAVAYLKTRALWLPIGLHFSWNFVMGFGYGLPISGIVLPWKLLEATPSGPVWLTGGDYGLEGSILCTGVLVVVTVWMVFSKSLRVAPEMAACLEERRFSEEANRRGAEGAEKTQRVAGE